MKLSTLSILALCSASASAVHADPPIWANTKHVKAQITECGAERSLVVLSDAVKVPPRPTAPGCKTVEERFIQLNVAKTYFSGGNNATFSATNATGGYTVCGKGDTMLTLGAPAQVTRAIREHPQPRGCSYTTLTYRVVSSLGSIPFTDVANGGTMSVKESLALHQKERDKIIADCNADAACRAEVARQSAINAYYECMKPQPYDRVCKKPW